MAADKDKLRELDRQKKARKREKKAAEAHSKKTRKDNAAVLKDGPGN